MLCTHPNRVEVLRRCLAFFPQVPDVPDVPRTGGAAQYPPGGQLSGGVGGAGLDFLRDGLQCFQQAVSVKKCASYGRAVMQFLARSFRGASG